MKLEASRVSLITRRRRSLWTWSVSRSTSFLFLMIYLLVEMP